jgi:hypothetical protein
MKLNHRVAATALAILTTAAVAGAGVNASPASAAGRTDRSIEAKAKSANGTLKGYALFDDVNNRLCARAYNSVSGAIAVASIRTPNGTLWAQTSDSGGDEQNNCIPINELPSGAGWTLTAFHDGTGGTLPSSDTAAIRP